MRAALPTPPRNISPPRTLPTCRSFRRSPGSMNFSWMTPTSPALIQKGREYSLEDQRFVMARERELLAKVLPAHATAAQHGRIEISTSAFYHPILPLVCDTNMGAVSSPGLPLPQNRFRHPEDAREQLERGLNLHQEVFGIRPQGVWPSEGSVSEEVFGIAQNLGVKWMATDEEVLGRTLGISFGRDSQGHLPGELAGEALHHSSLRERPGPDEPDFPRSHHLGFDRLRVFGHGPAGRPPSTSCATLNNRPSRFLTQDMMPWCRSSWMAKMRGNTILGPAGNFCAASTMRCSASREWRRLRCPRPSSGTSIFPVSPRWFRAPGFTPISMSGSELRKTTGPGTTSTTPAISMPRQLPRPARSSGNSPSKKS